MSKEGWDNYTSYESEFNKFVGGLQEEMSAGVKFNKENLGRRIEIFNRKNCVELRADELLFEVIDGEKFTLARQLYPFVMKELEIEAEESDKDDREIIVSEIEVLESMFGDLKDKYCPVN